jgi:hypothetical protein
MFRIALLAFSFSILAALPSAYAAPRSVDARDFDVCGVTRGMDWDQALAAAAKHFKIAPSEFEFINPLIFFYKKDGTELWVHFVEREPGDKARPLVVTRIEYRIPWTEENEAAMKEAALAKYGVPSHASWNNDDMTWCIKPPHCSGQAYLSFRSKLLGVGAASSSAIMLDDPAWREALIKRDEDAKARKPNF